MTSLPDGGVKELFDLNADTYDRVNGVISLGLDARWRDWAARSAVTRPGARVLDAFAGTGLVSIRAAELGGEVTLADFSPGMLAVAERRARERGVDVTVVTSDLAQLPLEVPGAPFDSVTVVFGVRYLEDPAEVLRGLASLLAEDGRLVVMDFVEPDRGLVSATASVYFFHVLPLVAGILARRRGLYDRLASSTRRMHGPDTLVDLVREAGLEPLETRVMGFGLVAGIVAAK